MIDILRQQSPAHRVAQDDVANAIRVTVPAESLPETCAALAAEQGARLVVMTGTDERSTGRGYGLYYVFTLPSGAFVSVEAQVDPTHAAFPSVTRVLPAAHWYEREVKDLLGVEPVGHPDPRRLVLHDDWPRGVHPLRKDFDARTIVARQPHPHEPITGVRGEGVMEVPVGPIHAGIIEPGHFRFGGVGELVLHLEARLFYTHRGIEKAAEGATVDRVLFLAERLCGVCSLSHAVAYSQAIESLAGVLPSERARLIRSVLLELERLYNHIGDIANICAGAALQLGVHQGGVLKERLQELCAAVAGHRYLFGVACPGGVRRDLDLGAQDRLRRVLAETAAEFRSYLAALLETDSFMERVTGTGVLPRDLANELGAVGVAARASGIALDARATHPYAALRPGMVTPVVRTEGDVRARMLVRADEAFASFALVSALLDELAEVGPGDLVTPIGPLPADRWALGMVESPRGEAVHWLMTGPRGEIARYRVRSASYNWAVVPFAVAGSLLPDFPLINKSFELCYACLDR
ncbi:MAG: NADH-quinone oxidoreductase subunit C [Candidatus Limnocylindria bacterium]|nr:NADH-quinone oxidoreductase subunit C [Candidatus Limnocylindria bacterium]